MGHTSSSAQPGPLPGLPCPLFPLGSVGHLNLSFISCLCYLEEQLEQVTEKRIKAATLSCVIKDKAHLTANNSDTQPALHIIHCLWTPSYAPSTCLEVTEYVPWAVFWEVPWGFCWLFFTRTQRLLWAAHTACTLVHLETGTQAQEGRQIGILSSPVNIKFLLEIHMSTPQRETPCTSLGFFVRLGITRCVHKSSILGLYS